MFTRRVVVLVFLSVLSFNYAAANDDCKERIRQTCKITVKNQCYYDVERGCFRHFQTNCDMEISTCKYNNVYQSWPETYCKSVQFLCQEEVDEFNWPPDNFYEQIEHLRDNATNLFEEMLANHSE
ncbi:uncharacterized protein [Musca autumnalis]|uniref:uncharacterized protein n=1 Tax=Musca autumnalis TaxID=221902 RepID=UPI003CF37462